MAPPATALPSHHHKRPIHVLRVQTVWKQFGLIRELKLKIFEPMAACCLEADDGSSSETRTSIR